MSKPTDLKNRKSTLFTSTISGDKNGETYTLGESLTGFTKKHTFAYITGSLLIGRKLRSEKTEEFINTVLKLLVDHGPYVSGSVNTMVAARAGKDMVSSLASGLLTVGNRFGGAINAAAEVWFRNVEAGKAAQTLVEEFAGRKQYIPGIGHRKYRVDQKDPRVTALQGQGLGLAKHAYLDYAMAVEKITTAKKANLILNVDGTIAAVMLDLLETEENMSPKEIEDLIRAEFFNSLFVISRTVGFIAHYLDQKRLNEPLFRLNEEDVLTVE